MTDEMDKRLSYAEWEIKALKEGQQRHDDRMAELSTRIDVHHREVMGAIGALRDEKSKAEGAEQAREIDARKRQNALKWIGLGVSIIMTMLALGWVNSAEAMMALEVTKDRPIPVQYHTRELP